MLPSMNLRRIERLFKPVPVPRTSTMTSVPNSTELIRSDHTLSLLTSEYEHGHLPMDGKTAFLNGELKKLSMLVKPEGIVYPEHPSHGVPTQESSLWLKTCSTCVVRQAINIPNQSGFTKGVVDPITLHEKKNMAKHLLLMSMMGQMSFFLGLQVSQNPRGIFINQSKYAQEILKKFGFDSCTPIDTPMAERPNLDEDKGGKS
ncbi:retrovirus-related pol polyprotein from transposon TNT 1-94 [Tanacetum coccineum]